MYYQSIRLAFVLAGGRDIATLMAQSNSYHCIVMYYSYHGDDEQIWKTEYMNEMSNDESAYATLQSTRPTTMSYAAAEPAFIAA